jgi:hypothetical protein
MSKFNAPEVTLIYMPTSGDPDPVSQFLRGGRAILYRTKNESGQETSHRLELMENSPRKRRADNLQARLRSYWFGDQVVEGAIFRKAAREAFGLSKFASFAQFEREVRMWLD